MEVQIIPVADEKQLKAIDEIYQQAFGDASIPFSTLLQWWQRFPKGTLALINGNDVVGGISYWPVNTATFRVLELGEIKERDIPVSAFVLDRPQLFYISDVAIKQPFRGNKSAYRLFHAVFDQIRTLSPKEEPVKILALGYSDAGRRLLERMRFTEVTAVTADGFPMYLLQVPNPDQLPA